MPLHLAPSTRREFLVQSAAAFGCLTLSSRLWGAEAARDPHRMALLSDTHIPERADVEARGTNMTANLKQVVQELLALQQAPASVLINGDCAYLKGLENDYANLAECVAPLSKAGLPLHLTMGNHDDRDMLYRVIAAQKPEQPLVKSKHVTVLTTPRANWFLLDSLLEVNLVTGDLGDEQRAWLAKALDAHADKPAIVVAHHTPQFEPPAEGKPWGGLRDTAAFVDILKPRQQVKAFVFGHSHNWNITNLDGLHLINLPPMAYVFGEGKPNGWVIADVQEAGLKLQLQTIDKQHPQHNEIVNLTWRN